MCVFVQRPPPAMSQTNRWGGDDMETISAAAHEEEESEVPTDVVDSDDETSDGDAIKGGPG